MTWTTKMSALSAGGYNNCVAYSPVLQGFLICGGDTFGFNASFDGGATFNIANLGLPNNTSGNGGVCGITFDPVSGKAYAGMGISPTIVVGNIVNDSQQRKFVRWSPAAASVGGFFGGGNAAWLPAGDTRPRATGRVLEVDNFGGTRYVYAQPWQNGIWRSTDDYATATHIYTDTATIGQQLNGFILDPTDKTRLLVGRWGYGDGKTGAAQIGNVRAAGAGAATYLSLSNAPPSVLEWCVIGTRVYAACSWGGVYRVSQTGGNWNTWTPMNLGLTLGTAGISGQPIYCGLTGYNDGTHDVLFACCANPPHIGSEYSSIWRNPQAEIATNAVSSWQNLVGVPANVNASVIGSNEQWWLKAADAAFMLGGSVGDMENLTIDPFDASRVHVVGRAGGWQTSNADAAAASVEWRPCVNGQAGTTTWMLVADPTRPNHFYTTNVDHVMVGTNNDFLPGSVFKNKPAGAANQGTWGDMGPDGKFYLGVGDRDTPTINGEIFQYSGDPVSSASVSMGLGASTAAGNKPQGLAITGTGSAPIVLAGVYNKGIMRRVASIWTNTLSAALLDPVPSKTNHFPTAKDADGQAAYFGGPDTGIFRSLNQGATWPQAGGGANGLWWAKDPGGFVGLSLGCDPVTPGLLYGCFSTGIWRVAAANVAGTNGTTAAVRITPATGPLTALQGMAISQAGISRGWVYACTAPTTGVDAQFWECQNPAAVSPTWTQQDDGIAFASAAYSLNWMAVDNQGGQIMFMPGGVFEVDSIPLQPGSTSSFPGAADVFVPPVPNTRLHIPGATPGDLMKRMNDAIEAVETAALVRTSPDLVTPETFPISPEVLLEDAESVTGWGGATVTLDATKFTHGSHSVSIGRVRCGAGDVLGKAYKTFAAPIDITGYATLSFDIQWNPPNVANITAFQAVVADGASLTGNTVIQHLPAIAQGQWVTVNLPLGALTTVRSIGVQAWTEGSSNPNIGVTWSFDYVRLNAQTQLETAINETTGGILIPPSYPAECDVQTSYPTKTVLDLRPTSALLQRHGGVRHLREWSVCDDGSQDVSSLLSTIIAGLPPRSTLLFSPEGQYKVDGFVNVVGTDVIIDGQGATIYTTRDRGIADDHMVYVNGNGITIRNLNIIGGRALAINNVLSAGTPIASTGWHLRTTGDEIMTDPAQVYYLGRDKDGLMKIGVGSIAQNPPVANDCLVRMVDAVTGQEMARVVPTLTPTPQPIVMSVNGAAWLGSQPRTFISKLTATASDVIITGAATLYSPVDYRGNHDQAAGFIIVGGNDITIEDCRVEGVQTDALQSNGNTEGLTIRRVQSIACSRQGMSINNGRYILVEDCLIRECGRTGIDFEPAGAGTGPQGVWHATVRGTKFVNVVNHAISNNQSKRLWYIRVEDCTSDNAIKGFILGGSHHGVYRNITVTNGGFGQIEGRNTVFDHITTDGGINLIGMGVFTFDASGVPAADPEVAALGPVTYANGGNMATNINVVGGDAQGVLIGGGIPLMDVGARDDDPTMGGGPYFGPFNPGGIFAALDPGKFGDVYSSTFKGLGFSSVWFPGGMDHHRDPISNARAMGSTLVKGNNLARVNVALPTGAIGATVNFPTHSLTNLTANPAQPVSASPGNLAAGTYYVAVGSMDIYGGPKLATVYNPVTVGANGAIRLMLKTGWEAPPKIIPGLTWFRAGPAASFPGSYSVRYTWRPTGQFFGIRRTLGMYFEDNGTALTYLPDTVTNLDIDVYGYPHGDLSGPITSTGAGVYSGAGYVDGLVAGQTIVLAGFSTGTNNGTKTTASVQANGFTVAGIVSPAGAGTYYYKRLSVPPVGGSFPLADETGWEPDTNFGVMVETSWPTVHNVTAKRLGGFDLSFATPAIAGASFSWLLVRG